MVSVNALRILPLSINSLIIFHGTTVLTGYRLYPKPTNMSVAQKALDGAYNKLKGRGTTTLHAI